MRLGARRSLLRSPAIIAAPAGISMFIGGASVLANAYSAGNKTFSANSGVNLPACLFTCGFGTADGIDPGTFQIGATSLAKVSNESSSFVQLWACLYAGGSDTITIGNGSSHAVMAVAPGWATGGSLIATAVSPQSETYGSDEANSSVHFVLSPACVVPAGGVGFVVGACLNGTLSDGTPNWANCETSPGPSTGFTAANGAISLACKASAGSWSPEFWGSGAHNYNFAAGLAASAFGT